MGWSLGPGSGVEWRAITRPGAHDELPSLVTALTALVPGVRPATNASVLIARADEEGFRAVLGWVYPGMHGRGEDAAFISSQLLVCCDGAGGHAYGDLAARLARDAMAGAGGDVISGLAAAQAAILSYQGRHREASDMATTLTAAAVAGGTLSLAHIGDSAAWLWRGNHLRLLSECHCAHAVPTSTAGGRPGARWVLTGYLGGDGAPPAGPQIARWQIEPGDVVLMSSAGLAWREDALAARLRAALPHADFAPRSRRLRWRT